MIRRVVAAWFVAGVLATTPCAAQSGGLLPLNSPVSVRMRDGSVLVGQLTEQTTDSVQVTTSGGRLTVARTAIADIRLLSTAEVHDGAYWAPDPHDTRLFFGPTGRTLERGSGYFSDVYLLILNGAYGITDRIMIGAGMSIVPFGDFFHDNLYYIAPKIALVRGDSFNLAVGALVGFSGRVSGTGTVYYLAATNGRPDASFTYGIGYATAGGTVREDVMAMLGGSKRVSRRLAIMSENYFLVGRGELNWAPVYGVRFIGERLSTDLGFVNYVGHDAKPVFPGVPWLGFALKF
jgi:hypothetical protein